MSVVPLEASTKTLLRIEKIKASNLLLNPIEHEEHSVKAVVRHLQKEDGTVTVIMEILPSTENQSFKQNQRLLLSKKLGFKTSFSNNTDIVIFDFQDFHRSTLKRRNKQKLSETKKENSNYLKEKINVTLGEETLLFYNPLTKVSASLEFKAPYSPLEAFKLIVSSYK
jgi:sucrose-6-phosphate hydrolase SacC (GH32 family)